MNNKENMKGIAVFLITGISFLLAYFFHQRDLKEWENCHIETEGFVKGFSLYSNKSLQVEIEYKKETSSFTTSAVCTNYLSGCYYSDKQKECIGRKCRVFYACNNPNIISYKLLEQDTLIAK